MINEPLYNKTVSILVDAYFKDTLQSGICSACAVGSLIAANNDYEIVQVSDENFWLNKNGDYLTPKWKKVVCTEITRVFGIAFSKKQVLNINKLDSETRKEIESTGYKLHEFALIENAFEKGYKGYDKMFNGLMSVVDCLDEIHKNKDVSITKKSKSLFKSQPVSTK